MTAGTHRPIFKRRNYLVAKRFQLKYVGLILLLMFLTAAMCSYVVYYTSMISMGEKLANVYPQGRLISIVRIVNLRIMLSVLLVSPLVVVLGIFLSHKIAGPIFRMERFLSGIAAGDLSSTITLRQGDELASLADKMNALSASLKVSVKKQRMVLDNAFNEFENLKEAIAAKPQDQSKVNALITRLDGEMRSISDELDKYKLEKPISTA